MIASSDERVTAFPGSESGRLRLAIPNKGRMQAPSLQLLHDAGLRFEDGTRALTSKVDGFPLDILFVRTDDIVEFVADGVADLGITGTNLLIENGADLENRGRAGLWLLPAGGRGAQRLAGAFARRPGRLPPGHQSPACRRDVLRPAWHRDRDRDHQWCRRGGARDGPCRRHRGPGVQRLDAHHERPALGGPALRRPGHPRGPP